MRYLMLVCGFFCLPLCAQAQEANRAASPMLVVSPQTAQPASAAAAVPSTTAAPAPSALQATSQTPSVPNFPDWAISTVGAKTSGQSNGVVAPPANPANPQAPANAATPGNPASPTAPASPANPVNKLWPRDTIPIFLNSCANFHVELVAPCTCVITNLMLSMGHDEFLAKSEAGTIEQDPRLAKARSDCATAPHRKG